MTRGVGRVPLLLLALLAPIATADAAQARGRTGTTAEVVLAARGPARPVQIEVRTDPAITGRSEMTLFVWRRGVGNVGRTVEPPVEPGLYRFERALPETADWGFTLRYGTGIDVYYASLSGVLDPAGDESVTVATTFEGGLAEGVPRNVQTAGFLVLALLSAVSLVLVAWVLRHLGRQRAAFL